MRGRRRPEVLLAALLRGEPVAPDAVPRLVAEAGDHGVAGLVRRALSDTGHTADASTGLDELRFAGLRTHLRIIADLSHLRAAFDGSGVPWLVVKGPVLAETAYEHPDLRSYGDLDVLVPPSAFAAAIAALEADGARVQAWNWWHRLDRRAGEVPLALASETIVDLHWHLVNDPDRRAAMRWSTDELLTRAVEVELRGERVLTLDPVDTLLHLLVHCATSGADRLIWLVDIDHLVRRGDVDWDQLVERARRVGGAPAAALALAKARALLATPVPRPVLGALDRGGVWRAVAAGARRVRRRAPNGRDLTLERAVAKATRTSTWASVRELMRRSRRADHATDHDVTMSERDHDPALREEGRRAYLDAVADFA
ncbi:MAG TPA: nucleotidyltransferase family protein [Acidimicrobiia bacterium]|nr:nucleotidyltransferase family protein [Acidimicrobiia bacterium]